MGLKDLKTQTETWYSERIQRLSLHFEEININDASILEKNYLQDMRRQRCRSYFQEMSYNTQDYRQQRSQKDSQLIFKNEGILIDVWI